MTHKKKIYGNCRVLHPDGQLMFLCVQKRLNWYIDRGLAELVSEEPPTIQLNFEPRDRGAMDEKYRDEDREYLLGSKQNMCVVCGQSDYDQPTKHHVVPHEYRKFLPHHLKNRSSHDVVPICKKHHEEYERTHALQLKKDITERFGASANSEYSFINTEDTQNT